MRATGGSENTLERSEDRRRRRHEAVVGRPSIPCSSSASENTSAAGEDSPSAPKRAREYPSRRAPARTPAPQARTSRASARIGGAAGKDPSSASENSFSSSVTARIGRAEARGRRRTAQYQCPLDRQQGKEAPYAKSLRPSRDGRALASIGAIIRSLDENADRSRFGCGARAAPRHQARHTSIGGPHPPLACCSRSMRARCG